MLRRYAQTESGIATLEQVSSDVRERRRALGMTQKRLAKMCGFSQSTVARMETDIISLNPSYQSIFYIMDALDRSNGTGHGEIMSRTAKEIMHKKIICVKAEDSLFETIEIFKDYDFPQLPVLDNSGHVIGTVYQRDLLNTAMQAPDMVKRKAVSGIMRASLPQVDKESELTRLKPILESAGAVIVADKGKAVGIITIYDILKAV
ncbi:MAG: CBS domain-containing protein [Candidatus Micrarchaeaceae archaeon]